MTDEEITKHLQAVSDYWAGRPLPDLMIWRPIETLPDGKYGDWIIVTSTWNKYARACLNWASGGWVDGTDAAADMSYYTHWMPLPAPPSP
jgi:hypothetical protein